MTFYNKLVKHITNPLILRYDGITGVYGHLKNLEEQQYMPQGRLQEIQWQRLKHILQYAYENTEYYRESFDKYGVHPRDIKNPSDMIRLPVLTKQDIIRNRDRMISKAYPPNLLIPSYSGGTSGVMVSFYYARDSLAYKMAATIRAEKWTGWDVGSKTIFIWPASQDHNTQLTFKSKIKNSLSTRSIMCPAAQMDERIIAEYVSRIMMNTPDLIRGFPTPLSIVAEYMVRNNIELTSGCNIISTGEPLFRHRRDKIERAFGGKVFDSYGAREVSLIGQECERHAGYHMNMECNYLEFVNNGRHAGPGEVSDMVVTDLVNKGMPFIRYDIDDQGIPAEEACTCGRGLALFSGIVGRDNDVLKTTKGGNVLPSALIMFMIEEGPEIGKMKIIQDRVDHLMIQLTGSPMPGESHYAYYRKVIKDLFGEDMIVEFEILGDITNEQSGKYRFTKYEVK
jgi:phenylacetate-CoA ligase